MAVRYVEIGQYPDVRREVRGNLSEILVATANPGTYAAPEDVTGCFLEMGTDGKWYGDLGELGTTGFRDSLFTGYLASGVTCKVSGVPYSWSGTGWVSTSNVAPCYDAWDLAIAAAGSTLGWTGYVKRLCGNGYFHVMHNGTRLEVSSGESIIRDAGPESAGYLLTAASVAYVPLASYVIPAGLIGDGEEWEADCFALFTTFVSGNSTPSVRLAANVITSQNVSASASRTVRNRGAFPRLGTTLQIRNNAATDIYSGGATDVSVDLGLDQTIDAGISMGAAGNVGRLRQWTFRRIG